MLPIATLTSTTGTGDVVTGPGAPTVLINGMPGACMGDLVTGPMCVGAISASSSLALLMGRPAATLTSMATGTNPSAMGAPAAVPVAMSPAPTTIA